MKKGSCKFNPNDYGYIAAQDFGKQCRQRKCKTCGLYTEVTHKKTSYSFSFCEGLEAVRGHMKAIRHLEDRQKSLAIPKPKKRKSQ